MMAGQIKRVILVCSNDTHVRMFAPVADELRRRGAEPILLGLDPFYGQKAAQAAHTVAVRYVEPTVARQGDATSFYDRHFLAVWRDVLHARESMAARLADLRPYAVVVGNDFGLIEKMILSLARRMGARGVLVQDGRLIEKRPSAVSFKGRVRRSMRVIGSVVLRRAGLGYLAASEYGAGGADLICASGVRSQALLERRAGAHAQVLVTGQPRYDGLATHWLDRGHDPLRRVAIFTTPFTAARLGRSRQERQLEMVRMLSAELTNRGVEVLVKPHPREDEDSYHPFVGQQAIRRGEPAKVLAKVDLAIVGISTVLEEAALMGCPVIVPGGLVHDDRIVEALPPDDDYPRFESVSEAVRLILSLTSVARRELVQRQLELVRRDLFVTDSAAARVADAVLE